MAPRRGGYEVVKAFLDERDGSDGSVTGRV